MIKAYLSVISLVLSVVVLIGFMLPLLFSMKSDESVYLAIFICAVSPIVFVWGSRKILKMILTNIYMEEQQSNKKENKDENK